MNQHLRLRHRGANLPYFDAAQAYPCLKRHSSVGVGEAFPGWTLAEGAWFNNTCLEKHQLRLLVLSETFVHP